VTCTGSNLLENLLINKINHHVHTNNLLNRNQYGFIPQSSTVDVAMAVKHTHFPIYSKRNTSLWSAWTCRDHLMRLGGPVYCANYVPSTVLEIYTIWLGATSVKVWRSSTLIHAE